MILGESKAIRINIFFPISSKTIKIAVNNYFRSPNDHQYKIRHLLALMAITKSCSHTLIGHTFF